MSFSSLLLILLIKNDPISSSFNGRLVTRPTLNRWSRSPESCGINWLPLTPRYTTCFFRMPLLVQEQREEYDRTIERKPTGTPPRRTVRVEPSHRMVGGADSHPGEFPWSVKLEKSTGTICNGAFLLSDWVLTVAHCMYNTTYLNGSQIPRPEQSLLPLPPGHFVIRYNADTVKVTHPEHLNITRVQEYFIHPDYNHTAGENDFDLSLMRLVENVSFFEIHRPEQRPGERRYYGANAICLPEEPWSVTSENEDVYWFSGYGPYGYHGYSPIVAQKQMVVPTEYFNQSTERYGLITESRIGYAACAGDSGSPVAVHNSDGRFFIAGIVRGGNLWNKTARCGYDYMYLCQVTRDDPLNWIKETIGSETGR